MSDAPTKTYPPEFLQRLIAGHEAEKDAATTEDSSAVRQKGDAMSEIERFKPDNSESMLAAVVWDSEGGWVRYKDHLADVERLTSKRDAAQAEVERLTQELDGRRATNQRIMTERNAALNEVERLRAEVERLRASGQGMLDTSRPTDEDIWREAFITMLPSYPWEKAAEKSDCVLVEYRKRWPR